MAVESPDMESTTNNSLSFTQRVRRFTPMVLFMTFYLVITAWNFGYDVSVFSGVEAMTPFIKKYGSYNEKTGTYAIASYLLSIMNSFPYLGKLLGCWVAAPFAERFGRKRALLLVIFTTFLGVVLQITATTAAQFTIGRMLCYGMTGISVIVMPAFMAECAPAVLRGMVTSQLQLQIAIAQLVASAVNYGTSTVNSNAGWEISIGIQLVMPMLLLVFYPIVVESPRWLTSQARTEEAMDSLRKLRGKNVTDEIIQIEFNTFSQSQSNEGKGTWRDIFRGTNMRRTIIAIVVMVGQQITGQAFVSQYSVVFYKQQGFNNSFELGMIQQALGVLAVMLTTVTADSFGRRRILLVGGIVNTIFLVVMGAMGAISHPSQSEKKLMVACIMLWFFFYLLSWASLPYVVLGEVPTRRVVEKTNTLAVSLSVISAFLVSFTAPYLIGAEYANLGGKVGFIYGALTALFTVLAFIYVPEMKGRSLEELDVMFHDKVSTRKFRTAIVSAADVYFDPHEHKVADVNITTASS